MYIYVHITHTAKAGTSLFENWTRASYNVVLSTPIIATGVRVVGFRLCMKQERAVPDCCVPRVTTGFP